MPKKKRSDFAQCLYDLLDAGPFNSLNDWARYLRTPKRTINRWLKDQALPKTGTLMLIYNICETHPGAQETLRVFKKMATRPARQVSPLGELMLPSVEMYIERDPFGIEGRRLETLSPKKQAKYLSQAYPA